MKVLATVLLLAAAWVPTQALAATVQGAVAQRTVRTVRPLANLLLTLRSPSGARSARVYTDRAGEFVFYNVPRGRYVLEIWRNGMEDSGARTLETCQLEVAGDVTLPGLRLHNSPLRIPPQVRSCAEGLEHLYTSG